MSQGMGDDHSPSLMVHHSHSELDLQGSMQRSPSHDSTDSSFSVYSDSSLEPYSTWDTRLGDHLVGSPDTMRRAAILEQFGASTVPSPRGALGTAYGGAGVSFLHDHHHQHQHPLTATSGSPVSTSASAFPTSLSHHAQAHATNTTKVILSRKARTAWENTAAASSSDDEDDSAFEDMISTYPPASYPKVSTDAIATLTLQDPVQEYYALTERSGSGNTSGGFSPEFYSATPLAQHPHLAHMEGFGLPVHVYSIQGGSSNPRASHHHQQQQGPHHGSVATAAPTSTVAGLTGLATVAASTATGITPSSPTATIAADMGGFGPTAGVGALAGNFTTSLLYNFGEPAMDTSVAPLPSSSGPSAVRTSTTNTRPNSFGPMKIHRRQKSAKRQPPPPPISSDLFHKARAAVVADNSSSSSNTNGSSPSSTSSPTYGSSNAASRVATHTPQTSTGSNHSHSSSHSHSSTNSHNHSYSSNNSTNSSPRSNNGSSSLSASPNVAPGAAASLLLSSPHPPTAYDYNLPNEVWLKIFAHIPVHCLVEVQSVCKDWSSSCWSTVRHADLTGRIESLYVPSVWLSCLPRMSGLTSVSIPISLPTNRCLALLASIPTIEAISIHCDHHTTCSGLVVATATLPRLQKLALWLPPKVRPSVLQPILPHLKNLTYFKVETLRRTFCERALVSIDLLQNLRTLDLSWCKRLSPVIFAKIARIHSLETLILDMCGVDITISGIMQLKVLPQLTELSLKWCDQLTDAMLPHLGQFPALQRLDVSFCKHLTAHAIAKHLPNVFVSPAIVPIQLQGQP